MPKLNGIELGKRIRSIYPECVIIYVTAYKEPCIDAIRMKADFYIFKPYSSKDSRTRYTGRGFWPCGSGSA